MATGTAAAARGGFTSVVCMPNTAPPIENAATVALIREKAEREAKVNVFITGAFLGASRPPRTRPSVSPGVHDDGGGSYVTTRSGRATSSSK
jgi:hypothetical protein